MHMEKKENMDITVKVTKIPGAMELITGQPAPRHGVFIPIDNQAGVCCNGYTKRLPDGGATTGYLDDIELNLTAYAFQRENAGGSSHGLKPNISPEMLQRMLESQVRSLPWVGFVTPWNVKKGRRQ